MIHVSQTLCLTLGGQNIIDWHLLYQLVEGVDYLKFWNDYSFTQSLNLKFVETETHLVSHPSLLLVTIRE